MLSSFYDDTGTIILATVKSNESIRVYDIFKYNYYLVKSNYDCIPMHILLTILESNIAEIKLYKGNTLELVDGSLVSGTNLFSNRMSVGVFRISDRFETGNVLADLIRNKLSEYRSFEILKGLNLFCKELNTSPDRLGIVAPKDIVNSKRKFVEMVIIERIRMLLVTL